MPVRWIIPVIICALLMSCNDDDYPNADIPSVALNKFRSSFPEASDVSWKKIREDYEVDFEVAHIDMKLVISTSGEIIKHKREIDNTDLPSEVKQYLNRTFENEEIEDPQMITSGEQIYYQVEIDRLLFNKKIVVDENGSLLETVSYWD